MDNKIEIPLETPELDKTLVYLFDKIIAYEVANREYGHTLRNVIFGVNGNRSTKMRLVGETILKSAEVYHSSSVDLIDMAFKGNPDPDIIVLRLNTFYGNMLQQHSPHFLSHPRKV